MGLIISRRIGEGFTIGEDIHIEILGHQGNASRIRITAPRELNIRRDELPAEPVKYEHRAYGVRPDGTVGPEGGE